MLSNVLIIDKRRELPIKYQKALNDSETTTLIVRSLNKAINEIQYSEPDLIIISDSINVPIAEFCRQIRTLTYNSRPIIVALSKSADINDKIQILDSGADDFWSEPVNIEEFKTRIKAHLRREIESNLDNKTLLPNSKFVRKSLKRVINSSSNAVLLMGLNNIEDYISVYSDIAGDKLIQAFIAIIKSAIEANDFLGQVSDSNFVLVTNPYRAEKIAEYLTFAFDTIIPKFYNENDSKRGYMLIKGERMAGMRVNFVSVNIGGIIEGYDLIKTPEALLDRLAYLQKISKTSSGSNYIIDRVKLSGKRDNVDLPNNKSVYINEPDSALELLLRTTLELQGYDVVDEINFSESDQPAIIILDSGDNLESLSYCEKIKSNVNFANTKLIVTTSLHDKTAVLNTGADLYLPKPYEISDLIMWIEYFLKKA